MYLWTRNISKIILIGLVLISLGMPTLTLAQPGFDGDIVPDCTGPEGSCGYCDLMALAENIISFLIFIALVVGILMIVYAGFLYVTAMSNPAQVAKAHSVFRVAIIGLVLVLASWLIINIILVVLGIQGSIIDTDAWNLPGCP